MARTTAKSGIGHQLRIGDGAGTEAFTAISEGKLVDGPKIAADVLDATHTDSDSGWKEFVVAQLDGGVLAWQGNYIGGTVQEGARTDLVAGTIRHFQVYIPSTTTRTFAFSAIVTNFSIKAGFNAILELSITLRITGAITVS